MSTELSKLLEYTRSSRTDLSEYQRAIMNDNCLAKRSVRTRQLTFRHLRELYSLDVSNPIFRGLLFFWKRERENKATLAFLAACTRDQMLREFAIQVIDLQTGSVSHRDWLESLIEAKYPDRFSAATLKSTAQNINSSLTKSGHLMGKVKKIRRKTNTSASSFAYALFLNYLCDYRGQSLFESGFASLLDIDKPTAIGFAENASRRGWIKMNRIGNVVELGFPKLLTDNEREILSGQN